LDGCPGNRVGAGSPAFSSPGTFRNFCRRSGNISGHAGTARKIRPRLGWIRAWAPTCFSVPAFLLAAVVFRPVIDLLFPSFSARLVLYGLSPISLSRIFRNYGRLADGFSRLSFWFFFIWISWLIDFFFYLRGGVHPGERHEDLVAASGPLLLATRLLLLPRQMMYVVLFRAVMGAVPGQDRSGLARRRTGSFPTPVAQLINSRHD